MIRVCLSDGGTLEVIGTMKMLDRQLVVRRCPHCSEVTLWDDHEDLKDKPQQTLKVIMDD